LNPDTPLHNTVHSFSIEGEIDEVVFKSAFQDLVDRVDALRTIFTEVDGIPYQSILSSLEHTTEVLDFSSGHKKKEIDNWLLLRSQQKLDLTTKSFDTALLKTGNEKYIWFLNMHHLITDAVSATLVFKYLSKIYRHVKEDTLNKLGTIPSFKSYIDFENKERNETRNNDIKTYWKEKIEPIKELPALYGAHAYEKTTVSTRISLKLGPGRSQKLKALAGRTEIKGWTQNLTLFNILATLYATFIYRVSGQKFFAFGAPMHNRTNKGFKETVGLFIEIFPIVVEFENDDTFATVFNRIKLESNDYLRYAQSGMATPEISSSFNSILNFINAGFSDFDGRKVRSEWMHPGHIDISHQMRCHVVDFDGTGELEILFDLNHGVFSSYLVEKVPQHFLNLFDAFIEDINTPIGRPGLLSKKEIDSYTTSGKVKAIQNSVVDQFHQTVEKWPTKNAVHYKTNVYSYAELNKRSNQLAAFLQKHKIEKGQRVGIHMKRSADYIVSVLAVLKMGAIFIPIPPDQPFERIKFIISDADCALVLSHSELGEIIDEISIPVISVDKSQQIINEMSQVNSSVSIQGDDLAYILYTSGSTGSPKGVLISHGALANYLTWAASQYKSDEPFIFPLFTAIGFDLTITATFLPLITGGELVVYKESNNGPDVSLMEVLEENRVNSIKLTPSHLALIQDNDHTTSLIKTMIVGGEDFKTDLAASVQKSFGKNLRIFNEYGPTEATVGCIVSKFDSERHTHSSVPIGKSITNMDAYLLDGHGNLVPKGVVGELYLSGKSLAQGYVNLEALTEERFVINPFVPDAKMYRTGDLARCNLHGELEYLGRSDEQVKLNGFRIELSDIEANLTEYQEIENAAVVLIEDNKKVEESEIINCKECGLPSSYPNIDFDQNDICHLCNSFKGYKEKTDKYFKNEDELGQLLKSRKDENRKYDCLTLLSGGKDSTYVLARLTNMGLRVLAFTLDNGYISEQAKANIAKITEKFGVDHIYGETPHMNKIFVDSLYRHKNVCNGCFKAIYTLSTKVALEKDIPFVVTGLSRGQFFETRLTEELFWDDTADTTTIDDTILEARKLYHQEEDAIKQYLDTSMFSLNGTFEKVQYVDFYRYSDVSLTEVLKYLKEKADWIRPTDTGRSTNCLINQVGIHVHKKERGYSNYAFPYSWDVRLGHKNRDEALEEINEYIDVAEVEKIMDEIGYGKSEDGEVQRQRLVGYYTGKSKIPWVDLNRHLSKKLPEYMLPGSYKYLEELPLTANGKVDKTALRGLTDIQIELDSPFVAPRNEIETLLEEIWKEVLKLKKIGVHDNFIILGGHSLAAIRVTSRLNEQLALNLPLSKIFELPTISEYAKYIEETLTALLEN